MNVTVKMAFRRERADLQQAWRLATQRNVTMGPSEPVEAELDLDAIARDLDRASDPIERARTIRRLRLAPVPSEQEQRVIALLKPLIGKLSKDERLHVAKVAQHDLVLLNESLKTAATLAPTTVLAALPLVESHNAEVLEVVLQWVDVLGSSIEDTGALSQVSALFGAWRANDTDDVEVSSMLARAAKVLLRSGTPAADVVSLVGGVVEPALVYSEIFLTRPPLSARTVLEIAGPALQSITDADYFTTWSAVVFEFQQALAKEMPGVTLRQFVDRLQHWMSKG